MLIRSSNLQNQFQRPCFIHIADFEVYCSGASLRLSEKICSCAKGVGKIQNSTFGINDFMPEIEDLLSAVISSENTSPLPY